MVYNFPGGRSVLLTEPIEETGMSTTYNPEAETIAQIERLEIEARNTRRRIDHAHNPEDRRALNKQLADIKGQIDFLRRSVP